MPNKSLSRSGLLTYQKYSSLLVGNDPYSPGSYDLIQSEILTGSQASVTFDVTGLGSTYQHLQLRILVRTDRANNEDWMIMRFNSDTGSNYSDHHLYGQGSSVYSNASTSSSYISAMGAIVGNNATANSFAGGVIDILDPFETTKYTTTRTLGGFASTTNSIRLESGNWRNTAALTAITLDQGGGSNFVSGSRFSLYGLKVA